MLKYIILAILGTTVSAQCCDRRAPECQSQYQSCMTSTNGNFQQCDSVFCKSEPYPLPTICCDERLPECQMKYQQCLSGTFGSFSLCAPTFCKTTDSNFTPAPTRMPEPSVDMPTPAPTRMPPEMTSIPQPSFPDFGIPNSTSTCCERDSMICMMAYNACKRENGMFCESMFCGSTPIPTLPPMPSIPADFTCCNRELESCEIMHKSCVASGSTMCDMMYCERTPLPSRSAFPSRKPRPSPRFSAFPSPKFLRPVPSILPKEIKSSLQIAVKERKEIESITKIKEIQVKISCSLKMPLDNIKIRNITFIDLRGIRNIIKFNETEIDDVDIPPIDCFSSTINGRILESSNVDIDYIVIDPTAELIAYDPVNLVSSVSNAQPSSVSQQSSSTNLVTVLASVFGTALAMIGLASMFAYIRARNKTRPIQTQERVIRVSINPLEAVTSLPRTDSSRRQFGPQGARV